MPLLSRILPSEAREARAATFYAESQRRKLSVSSASFVHPDLSLPSSKSAAVVVGGGGRGLGAAPLTSAQEATVQRELLSLPITMATEGPQAGGVAAIVVGKNAGAEELLPRELKYLQYSHALEEQYLPAIRALISRDLSEPYSIYVYRYFLYQWGHLCYMALHPTTSALIGVIISKLEPHASHSPPTLRGYIAMLAVSAPYRGHGIATKLVKMAIDAMAERKADEIVLETEESNAAAMRLYERLGFLRSKKLHRYYLNGSSAYRLVLVLRSQMDPESLALSELEDAIG